MELRPFRAIRYSLATIEQRGLSRLIAPPSEQISRDRRETLLAGAPENIARVTAADSGAGEALRGWLVGGIVWKERRPGLWNWRQTAVDDQGTWIVDMLVGLVRVQEASSDIVLPQAPVPAETRARRLGFLGETKADLEPSLLVTRAPFAAALATRRRPDLSAVDDRGVRHDLFRISDFAQHVDLQGRVKNVEAMLASGFDRYDAARQFANGPAATKLPGARYKLCAILDEAEHAPGRELPVVYAGLFGFSLEDPVY